MKVTEPQHYDTYLGSPKAATFILLLFLRGETLTTDNDEECGLVTTLPFALLVLMRLLITPMITPTIPACCWCWKIIAAFIVESTNPDEDRTADQLDEERRHDILSVLVLLFA